MKTALLEVRPVAAIFEIWLRNIRRFRWFRPVEHPLHIGCLPAVHLIRKIVDNMNCHQLRHGVKHWIHKPEPFSYTHRVHEKQRRTIHSITTTPALTHIKHSHAQFLLLSALTFKAKDSTQARVHSGSNFNSVRVAKCLVIWLATRMDRLRRFQLSQSTVYWHLSQANGLGIVSAEDLVELDSSPEGPC